MLSARDNICGVSCVEVDKVEYDTPDGPVIHVRGADLMDMTPIYDIKPYIRYADSHPEAVCGYVDTLDERTLTVVIPEGIASSVKDKSVLDALVQTLSLDPRPSYHDDPDRVYGLSYAGMNVRFKVFLRKLTVIGID